MAKIELTVIFCLMGNWRFQMLYIGRIRIKISLKILRPAWAMSSAGRLIHVVSGEAARTGFQAAATGLQGKMRTRKPANEYAATNPIVLYTMIWVTRLGNKRRYKQQIDNLAKAKAATYVLARIMST
jgi:hypothetical protein